MRIAWWQTSEGEREGVKRANAEKKQTCTLVSPPRSLLLYALSLPFGRLPRKLKWEYVPIPPFLPYERDVVFRRKEIHKYQRTQRKSLGARKRVNNKLNPHRTELRTWATLLTALAINRQPPLQLSPIIEKILSTQVVTYLFAKEPGKPNWRVQSALQGESESAQVRKAT